MLMWPFLIKNFLLSVVVVVVVNFSHFHLLLQNHWTNFNKFCILRWWGRSPMRTQLRSKEGPRENTLTKFKNLPLQNHWANFNQTWHKASLVEGDSSLFKWRATPFPRGDNNKMAYNYKIFLSRTDGPVSTKLCKSILGLRRLKFIQIWGRILIQGEIITKYL